MADWLKEVVQFLLQLRRENPELAQEIIMTIKKIEQAPARIGTYVEGTLYSYTDPENRFRISYHFHPDAKEIEIFVIHVLNR